MKYFTAMIFIIVLLLSGCKDSITYLNDGTPRIVLSADKVNGISPLTVNFIGTFLGEIDTLSMYVPAATFYSGHGKTIVRYTIPDTSEPAKNKYSFQETYYTGTYKTVLLLQSKYKDYYSDTLIIKVD